jgi:lipopolysaccharide transport system permease protein
MSETAAAVADDAAQKITVITPRRGYFDWRLDQLWRYRDLIGLFVWRDFVSVYKQTILGPLWHVIRPLFTTATFTVVFGRMAGLSTDGTPPFLFYMLGNVVWAYFSACLESTSRTFIDNANLLGKVYFHRMTIPISMAISGLVSFGIQFALFLIGMAYYAWQGTPLRTTYWIWLSPILLLMLAGYALGGGIIVCALTTRYRDLRHLVTFGVQLLLYLTPVIYPLSSVPASYQWIVKINPLTPILEAFRMGFLGAGSATPADVALSFVVMCAVLTAGLMLFTRVERTFMDTV